MTDLFSQPQARHSPSACIASAQALCQALRDDEAIELLRHGLRRYPGNRKMTLLLARSLRNEGRYPEAHDLLAALLPQAPEDIDLLKLWATVLQVQGRLPESVAVLQQVLALLCQRPARGSLPRPAEPRVRPQEDLALLWQTLAQLANDGLHAFATAGTLLGLVREGHLLAHDKDFDIGLPWQELPAAVACLQQHGWRELHHSNGLSNPRTFIHPASRLALDLCVFADANEGEGCVGGFWMARIPPHWNRLTDYPALQLHVRDSPAGTIWALRDPQGWLAALYGPDWRTPDGDFDSSLCACNLRGFSLLTQSYALLRIADAWHTGQLRKALRAARATLRNQPDSPLLQAVCDTLAAQLHTADG